MSLERKDLVLDELPPAKVRARVWVRVRVRVMVRVSERCAGEQFEHKGLI